MPEKIYDTLWETLCSMKKHATQYKSNLIRVDDPKRLLFGWACSVTNDTFLIRLSDMKRRRFFPINHNNLTLEDLMCKLITTVENRDTLGKILSYSENSDFSEESDPVTKILERYNKLEAFW